MIEELRPETTVLRLAAFAGVQTVHATQMTLGEYLDLRGWGCEDDPGQEGYMVEVPEFGPGHLAGTSGFTFWAPRDAFEAIYSPMPSPSQLN